MTTMTSQPRNTTEAATAITTRTNSSPVRTAGNGAPIARRALAGAGLVGIAAIHLADLPGKMSEVPYLGWAYIGLIVASLVLAEVVITRADRRAMAAAAALAAAVLVGFVVNRTVGMPNATDDIGNWTEPLGMISLLVEAVVVWTGARAWFAKD